jgi:CRISPR-associated endonuclease Csn1
MRQEYKLSLDLGTNSIGWCVFDLKKDPDDSTKNLIPCAIRKMGVRLFSEPRNPKNKTTLAAARRAKRLARRNLQRFKQRKNKLINLLVKHRLMPDNETDRLKLKEKNPYLLRHKAIREQLSLFEIGRAIYNLNIRRGFKSNRKELLKEDSEKSKLKQHIKHLESLLKENNYDTIGDFLYARQDAGLKIKCWSPNDEKKASTSDKEALKDEFFISRELVKKELELIWETQRKYHPEILTDNAFSEISDCILSQRPLKSCKELIGTCSYERNLESAQLKRAPRALVSHELLSLFQRLGNLKYLDKNDSSLSQKALTIDQIFKVYNYAWSNPSSKLEFSKIREICNFDSSISFNYEKAELKKQNNSKKTKTKTEASSLEFVANLAAIKELGIFSNLIKVKDFKTLDEIIYKLVSEADDEEVFNHIESKVDKELSEKEKESLMDEGLAKCAEKLKSDYASMCEIAINKFLGEYLSLLIVGCFDSLPKFNDLENKLYPDRAKQDGFRDELPFYGDLPLNCLTPMPSFKNNVRKLEIEKRITNPTVHVALNQLRLIVNSLIKKYGKPAQISLELARDLKNSKKEKERIATSQEHNKDIKDEFKEFASQYRGNINSHDDLVKFKLWKEMKVTGDRLCVYSDKKISCTNLFSNEIQIEHIKPFSKSLDDSLSNKVLAHWSANQDKKNKTPYQAFSNSEKYSWEEIKDRSYDLFYAVNRKKYFNLISEEEPKVEDFLARQLTDTQYISRVARKYLSCLIEEKNIFVNNGRVTKIIRDDALGLSSLLNPDSNTKDRRDHRHHALDAFVVGIIDSAMVNRIHRASARNENIKSLVSSLKAIEGDNSRLLEDLETHLMKIQISVKPDHSIDGEIHKESIYGLKPLIDFEKKYKTNPFKEPLDSESYFFGVERVKLDDLKDFTHVVNPYLREQLKKCFEEKANASEAINYFKESVSSKTKKIKVFTELNPAKYIVRKNESGEVFQGFKSGNNAFAIIYKNLKNKYEISIVSTFDAYQARKIARVYKSCKEHLPKYIDVLVNNNRPSLDSELQYVLFQGDIIQIDNPDKTSKFKKVNLLVKSFRADENNVIVANELLPVELQSNLEGFDKKKGERRANMRFFNDHQPIKLKLSPIGA